MTFERSSFMPQIPVLSLQNSLITPVPAPTPNHFPGLPKPSAPADKWLLVLTGVYIIDLQGNNPDDWRRETIHIELDPNPLLTSTIDSLGGTIEAVSSYSFLVAQQASFAAISSVFDKDRGAVDAGFAVDGWRLSLDNDVFHGLDVDVAVRNTNATLHRISFHLTLLGTIHGNPLLTKRA
jgi:hypothetical protein